jgi:hypothetical protein
MRRLFGMAVISSVGMGVALAQTDGAPASPPNAAASSLRDTVRQIRQTCREDAIARGLIGDARGADIDACFTRARPDIAKAYQCRKEGMAKQLVGNELFAYVKKCKSGAQ